MTGEDEHNRGAFDRWWCFRASKQWGRVNETRALGMGFPMEMEKNDNSGSAASCLGERSQRGFKPGGGGGFGKWVRER